MGRLVASCMLVAALAVVACDKNNPPNDDGGGALDLAVTPDFAMGGPVGPTCMAPPGIPACATGYSFQASASSSGCFPNGTQPAGAIMPPFDDPMGTCASVGDIVVACTNSPNCSFCMKNVAIPPGCAKQ